MTQQLISFEQQRINVLSLSRENFVSPYFFIDPQNDAKNAQYYETLWTVAAYMLYIGFTILSIGGMIVLGRKMPELIPFSLATIFEVHQFSLQPLFEFIKNKALYYGYNKDVALGTLKQIRKLECMPLIEYKIELSKHTAAWCDTSEVKDALSVIDPIAPERAYIPILARHLFWKEHAQKAHNKAMEILKEASQMRATLQSHPDPMQANRDAVERKILQLENEAYELIEGEELSAKIKAAFFLSILQQPLKAVDISYYGQILTMPASERFLRNAFEQNEDEKNPYFIKRNGKKVSRDWLINEHFYTNITNALFSD